MRARLPCELAGVDDPHDDQFLPEPPGSPPARFAGAIEQLLAVGRQLEIIDTLGERLLLACLQIEPSERRLATACLSPCWDDTHAADVVNLPLSYRQPVP